MHDLDGHDVDVFAVAPCGRRDPVLSVKVTRLALPDDSAMAIKEAVCKAVEGAVAAYCGWLYDGGGPVRLFFHDRTEDVYWERDEVLEREIAERMEPDRG